MATIDAPDSLSWLGGSRPVQAFSSALGLRVLPQHIDRILLALAAFHVLYSFVAEPVTRLLLPKRWESFDARSRADWKLRVVSLVQSLFLGPASLYVLWRQEPALTRIERAYGYFELETRVTDVAMGYFLWHFGMMVAEYQKHGIQMVVHAVIGVGFLGGVYYPFTPYYTVWFLVYEITNPSQNLYRILARLGKGTSTVSIANAVAWIVLFLLSRIVWGTYATLKYWSDILWLHNHEMTPESLGSDGFAAFEVLQRVGFKPSPLSMPVLVWCFTAGTALAALNYVWFYLIVSTTVRKVLEKHRRS